MLSRLRISGRVVSRGRWRAEAPRRSRAPRGPLVAVVLHHTDVPIADLGFDRASEAAYMRRIQHAHFAREFADIGYHFVVMPSGRIYEGRPISALGAHVAGHNTGSIGIAVAGDFNIEQPSAEALAGVAHVLDRLVPRGREVPLLGHQDLAPKDCPGRFLYPYVEVLGGRASHAA